MTHDAAHPSAAADRGPRGPQIGTRSITDRRAARRVATAMTVALCVGGAARGEPLKAAQLDGRWVNVRQNLTLDISRCGDGWCGVEVKGGQCSRTALRLTANKAKQDDVPLFNGRLALADKAEPYVLKATLFVHEGIVRLQLLGQTGDRLELLRRWYPLNELMARSGPPQCKPDATVS